MPTRLGCLSEVSLATGRLLNCISLFRGGLLTEREYFGHLEMRISREFAGMRETELRGLWCDGLILDDFNVVGNRCRITGCVWIAFGRKRQESWQFVLYLGEASSRDKINWASILPAEDVTGWLSMDFKTKFMTLNPLVARADGPPGAR